MKMGRQVLKIWIQTICLIKHLIVLPDDDTMARYKEIFDTIINSVYQNGAEMNKLETIRDSLLPKLMSGEIRVPIEEADN